MFTELRSWNAAARTSTQRHLYQFLGLLGRLRAAWSRDKKFHLGVLRLTYSRSWTPWGKSMHSSTCKGFTCWNPFLQWQTDRKSTTSHANMCKIQPLIWIHFNLMWGGNTILGIRFTLYVFRYHFVHNFFFLLSRSIEIYILACEKELKVNQIVCLKKQSVWQTVKLFIKILHYFLNSL